MFGSVVHRKAAEDAKKDFYRTLAPYMPIVWLNVSDNVDWVLQTLTVLSVQENEED